MRVGLTAKRLVDAGAKLADEAGFEAVTPTALAGIFGVKVASLYSHIANADELKTRVSLLALDRLADRATDAVAGRSGKDALLAFADAHRDFAKSHPGQFAAARHPLSSEAAMRSGGVRLSTLTRSVLRGYRLEDVAEVHAVRLIGSFILGFVMLEASGGFIHSQPSSDVSWRASLDALHDMVSSLPTVGDRTRSNATKEGAR